MRADGCGANPTYLAQRGSLLFAAHELDSCGRMAAYAIEPDVSLTCRGACTAPYDAGTCFVLPDPNGRNLFGANYLSGSVACCALLDDGVWRRACRRGATKGAVCGTIGRRGPMCTR